MVDCLVHLLPGRLCALAQGLPGIGTGVLQFPQLLGSIVPSGLEFVEWLLEFYLGVSLGALSLRFKFIDISVPFVQLCLHFHDMGLTFGQFFLLLVSFRVGSPRACRFRSRGRRDYHRRLAELRIGLLNDAPQH